MRHLLVAAHDTGGANMLVPVIAQLSPRADVRLRVVACAEAVRVFSHAGVPHRVVAWTGHEGARGGDLARQLLAECKADVLLLGTSWGPTLEKALLKVAGKLGIPSISVVDSWSNFRERFAGSGSGALCLPSRVVVPDERAVVQAEQEGVPRALLIAIGQPHLEALAEALRREEVREEARRLRAEWRVGGSPESPLVLFASEAFSTHQGPDSLAYLGYTEVEALEGVVGAVQQAESALGQSIRLLVKLHPQQSIDTMVWGRLAAVRDLRMVDGRQPIWPCLLAADVIVGMSSMVLIEAALAGTPAISFRPEARAGDSFVGSELGLVPSATTAHALLLLLTQALKPGVSRARGAIGSAGSLIGRNAAARIAELVMSEGRARCYATP